MRARYESLDDLSSDLGITVRDGRLVANGAGAMVPTVVPKLEPYSSRVVRVPGFSRDGGYDLERSAREDERYERRRKEEAAVAPRPPINHNPPTRSRAQVMFEDYGIVEPGSGYHDLLPGANRRVDPWR